METPAHMTGKAGAPSLSLHVLRGLPMVAAGDDLAGLLIGALEENGIGLRARDVLVIAQKIVSKAEGRMVDLAGVTPSQRARDLSVETGKDARFIELVLSESVEVVKARPHLIITAHRNGQVMANAGIDQSNVGESNAGESPFDQPHAGASGGPELALLLPQDADASAAALRARLEGHFGCPMGLVINDSFGRPWRRGTVGVALGVSGLPGVIDLRGRPDLFGRALQTSEAGFADEVASAASLLMGQAGEGIPAVLLRGLQWDGPEGTGASICRDRAQDMFR